MEILPLTGIGEAAPGADISALIAGSLADTGLSLEASDILVVTQKIVSKSKCRMRELSGVSPSAQALELARITGKNPALVELVLQESSVVVREVPYVLITRHKLGFAMANAGIDRSNIGQGGGDRVLLLPTDPDASARSIAKGVERRCAVRPAVVVSDSFGRPWRHGVVGVAIGADGLPSIIDRRGELDRDGRSLEVTQVALADMIASAAGLVAGEGDEGIPVVLVRGFRSSAAARPATALIRAPEEDLFR